MAKSYPYLTHLDTSCKNIYIGPVKAFYNALYLAMVKYNIKHNIKQLSKQYMMKRINPLVPDWYFYSFCRTYIKESVQRLQMLKDNVSKNYIDKIS